MNEHFTEELLALLFRSRIRRLKRMQDIKDQPQKPRYVSTDHFFNAPIGKGLGNPNQGRIHRVQVKPN